MWYWFTFWLLLHILAVVIAFGPIFVFPLIGVIARKHPAFGPAFAHLGHAIEMRLTVPFALSLPLSGTGLIFTAHVDFWGSTWILIAVSVYILAIAFALLVQAPNAKKLIEAVDAMPPGSPPPGAGGPPPHIAAITKKLQTGGMFLTLAFLVIITLMIWRPGGAFTG